MIIRAAMRAKPYMMPLVMGAGALFHNRVGEWSGLTPYLLFVMLLLTYCRIEPGGLRLSRLHLWLILIQVGGTFGVYGALRPLNPVLAQGVMMCVLAPTATAAPVITGMLGGNVASVAAYSLVSNLCVACLAPLLFSVIGDHPDLSFLGAFLLIAKRVAALLLLPLALAVAMRRLRPTLTAKLGSYTTFAFYLWCVALLIVTGRIVAYIAARRGADAETLAGLAGGALVVCVAQFLIGRSLGARYREPIAGGQSLGQKNTILAIWMTQAYLNPLASVGPGAYVLWQNSVNAVQVWRQRKHMGNEDIRRNRSV